jgi:hypothetical protein
MQNTPLGKLALKTISDRRKQRYSDTLSALHAYLETRAGEGAEAVVGTDDGILLSSSSADADLSEWIAAEAAVFVGTGETGDVLRSRRHRIRRTGDFIVTEVGDVADTIELGDIERILAA